eukprot:scaffold38293_cov328-Amphora_coffeaeformis.AAC.1
MVLDVGTLRKTLLLSTAAAVSAASVQNNSNNGSEDIVIPPLRLSNRSNQCLVPIPYHADCPHWNRQSSVSMDKQDNDDNNKTTTTTTAAVEGILDQVGICYWHASVLRGRSSSSSSSSDGETCSSSESSFLAQLDIPVDGIMMRTPMEAYLALGLNNHHVG